MSNTGDINMVQLPSDDSGDEIELPSDNDSGDGESLAMDGPQHHAPAVPDMWMEKLKFEDLYQQVLRGNEPFQLLAEVFSPPRVTKRAQHHGHATMMAFDITHNGWDCMEPTMRKQLREIIAKVQPKVLVLSPPCTMFSALTRTKIKAYC